MLLLWVNFLYVASFVTVPSVAFRYCPNIVHDGFVAYYSRIAPNVTLFDQILLESDLYRNDLPRAIASHFVYPTFFNGVSESNMNRIRDIIFDTKFLANVTAHVPRTLLYKEFASSKLPRRPSRLTVGETFAAVIRNETVSDLYLAYKTHFMPYISFSHLYSHLFYYQHLGTNIYDGVLRYFPDMRDFLFNADWSKHDRAMPTSDCVCKPNELQCDLV